MAHTLNYNNVAQSTCNKPKVYTPTEVNAQIHTYDRKLLRKPKRKAKSKRKTNFKSTRYKPLN